ncbi:type II secretion system F family protein [Aureibacillus halotolerans]|uniref:Tight adherence protein B n=1 Tax=Aureibacillus halotolerans TaxID=1508390 RepID=A0A4R6UBR6_9BACI|nr:type II secretion system F family protein [Aureibacillus halotolerans]TDQ42195.1 tight adherence protein B [Aureibacillus halotolerans]
MDVLILALVAGVIIMLLFAIADRKKKKSEEQPEEEVAPKEKKQLFGKKPKAEEAEKPKKTKKKEPTKKRGPLTQYETNYAEYQLSKAEWLTTIIAVAGLFFLIGIVFYQNAIVGILLSGITFFSPKFRRAQLIVKRKEELSLQFKQALYSLSSSLAAGKSLENAFREVVIDLKLLYPDERTYIIREFELINRKVENGTPIERAVENFAVRSDIDDIQNFSDVITTCKRTGGDLVEVVRRTSTIIGDKLDIQQEITVVVSQKRLESRILNVAPFIMITALSLGSPDYMAPLYEFPGGGPFIMTLAIGVLVFSYWLSQKIMNIKV